MAGTKAGAKKIIERGIATYGSYEAYKEELRRRSSKGGSAKVPKGWAITGKAAEAGSIGGSVTLKNRQYKLAKGRVGIKLTRDSK